MKCEGCGKDAEMECADCAPKGADSEPLLLCQQCCSSVHIGQGRLSKHRVVSLTYKKQGLELKAKFEKYNKMAGELKKRRSQVNSCKEDIDERVKIYERQIRETTLAVCQKIKQRAITLIKKMKEAAGKRASDIDGFEKYLNNTIFSQISLIRKELHALDKTPPEDYQEKVKAIEEQIDAMDFSHLREHLPSTCLEYSIDFAGVQQGIRALDFELLEPTPDNPVVENVTEAPKYLADSIEDATQMKVCIQTAVSKAGEFWLQPDFPTDVYDKLIDISHKLRQDFICNLDWKAYEPEDEELQAGALCCVLYPSDNKWYRGCVEELRSDRKSATVRYLDFGNTSMLSVSQILPYKCPVPGVPFQAVECRLSGLTEDLSHEAKWTFNDTVREKLLDCKFLKKETEGSSTVWLVELSLCQQDGAVINLNHMVRDRVLGKTQKEAISCRDVRLLEDNLPSSFKVISTTVKTGDSAPDTVSTGEELTDSGALKAGGDHGDAPNSENKSEPPKEHQNQASCSQDIRKVVSKSSQDIRNQPRSQDLRKSTSTTSKSQDVRKQAPSQDVRKSNQDNQDGRHGNSGNQEQMDDCSSFLSSIGIGGFSSDGAKRGPPAAVSLERIAEGWKHRQVGRKVKSRSKHRELIVAESVASQSTNPQMLTEIEASSEIASGPMIVSSGGEERLGTWIPNGRHTRPQSGKSSVLVSLKPPPGSSSLEREAQEVVDSVIQEIVSRFCMNGKMAGTEAEVSSNTQPIPHFSEDLAYDMESRGSDEHSTETLTPYEDVKQQDLEDDSEETAVKSLLEEDLSHANLAEVKFHPYTKSNSGSMEDINVKDSVLKPEIQDKSLSNLCGYDLEETIVKVVRTEDSSMTENETCDTTNQSQLLSMSTNEISQLDSMGPASDQWESKQVKRDYSLCPEEDTDLSVASCSVQEDETLYSQLPRIMFVAGSTFMLYVVDGLHMNGTFCGQIARTVQEEKMFEQFTQELRNHALNSNTYPVVKEGALLLAPYENSWYRAQVIKVNPDQTVKVCFVDYGNSDTVTLRDLKALPRNLVYVPHQTTTCSLVSFYQMFTGQECETFNKITHNQKLLATVVAHGYSHLQVTLAVTLDTGEIKDVATMIAEKAPRSAAQGTTNASANKHGSDKGSRTTPSVESKISILHQVPDCSMSAPAMLTGTVQSYPSLPYIDMTCKPVNSQYYHRDKVSPANVTDYPPRRGVTLEAFPPRDPQVSAHQYSHNGDICYPPPRYPFAQPPDAMQLLRSPTPSRLREDATPFHPGSVYISPLKTDESLDVHLDQAGRVENRSNRHPIYDSSGAVRQSEWQVDCESVTSDSVSLPAAVTLKTSLTSEPSSVTTSSAFDEDAWIEFETSKWPSCESVPSCAPSQPRASSSSRRPQSHRIHSNRQRNARSRVSRESKDVHRSGNSSDSSDRGDRRSVTCYNCNKTGHIQKNCPGKSRQSRQNWKS